MIGSTSTWGVGVVSYIPCFSNRILRSFYSRAYSKQLYVNERDDQTKKKVVIVGSGWAGLSAAHHLCNQVKFPIFQDLPQLPTPLGTLVYTEFIQLPLLDRLTSLSLMAAVIDFDNTDTAWKKYDSITARELFKQFGCSGRLYSNILDPLLQVGLCAPAKQCSAAATLGILYYIILAHQKDFDLVWCRGTVKEKIFLPWMDSLERKGCKLISGKEITDIIINEYTNCLSEEFL